MAEEKAYRTVLDNSSGARRLLDLSDKSLSFIQNSTKEKFVNLYLQYCRTVNKEHSGLNLNKFDYKSIAETLYDVYTNLENYVNTSNAKSIRPYAHTKVYITLEPKEILHHKKFYNHFDEWIIKKFTKYQLICKHSQVLVLESSDRDIIVTAYKNSLSLHPITQVVCFEPYLIKEIF